MGYLNLQMAVVPSFPPLWRESRVALEAAQLFRSPVWHGAGVAPGNGRPVLLVPGFMAGDGSLSTMAKWLRANGYRTTRTGIRANIGCSEAACKRLEDRVEALAERSGQRVAIVGQSRGGMLARVVAVRRPDLIAGIVCLGAPTLSWFRVHPIVLLQVGLVGALGTGRVPGILSIKCLRGDCCKAFRTDLPAEFPPSVRYVSVYSRSDGIVDWRACLDPAADEQVEVNASHIGMALNEEVYRVVAATLADLAQPGLAAAA
jgi:pimeloyl-ACP methyl ester carboxylesterase